MNNPKDMLVTLTVAQLEEIVAGAVQRGIAAAARVEPLEYLTLEQVSALIGVCTRTVLSYVNGYGLPGSKLGSEWRFARADVVLWMGKRQHQPKKAS